MTLELRSPRCARATLIIAFVTVAAGAQSAADPQSAAAIMPPHKESRAKIILPSPDVQYLSGRSAVIRYSTENLRVAPVFGSAALAVSPRVGHVHVSVDDIPWVWAHTSEEPVFVNGLAPGQHKVRLQLMNANHQPLDEIAARFTSPEAEAPAAATAAPPVQDQPPARIIVDAPLPEPLARGVVFIRYRAENLDIVPVFGKAAAEVSPRIGHLHVTVDDTNWYWVDASRNPIIVQGLSPGAHEIRIRLANANHQVIDQRTVEVTIPAPHKSGPQNHNPTLN